MDIKEKRDWTQAPERPWERVIRENGLFVELRSNGVTILHWGSFDRFELAVADVIVEAVNSYERLVEENKRLDGIVDYLGADPMLYDEKQAETDALKARIAELEGLLQEVVKADANQEWTEAEYHEWLYRVQDALAKS